MYDSWHHQYNILLHHRYFPFSFFFFFFSFDCSLFGYFLVSPSHSFAVFCATTHRTRFDRRKASRKRNETHIIIQPKYSFTFTRIEYNNYFFFAPRGTFPLHDEVSTGENSFFSFYRSLCLTRQTQMLKFLRATAQKMAYGKL